MGLPVILLRRLKIYHLASGAQVLQGSKNLLMLPTIVAVIFMLLIDEIIGLKSITPLLLTKQKIELQQVSILQVLLTMPQGFI